MSNNLFDSCKTEADIMKRVFELSSSDRYTRTELLSLSNKRRSELQQQQNHKLDFIRVVLPEGTPSFVNDVAKRSVSFSTNPKGSSIFEFLPNGMVRF